MKHQHSELQSSAIMKLIFFKSCLINGVSFNDAKSKSRKPDVIDARRMFIDVTYNSFEFITLRNISNFTGLQHSTVLHHLKKSKDLYAFDMRYIKKLDQLTEYKNELIKTGF